LAGSRGSAPRGVRGEAPKCYQTACKPGSVRGSAREPTGRPFLWDAPRGTPHATNPGGEAGMLLHLAMRPPLFGLAPGGVYPAAPVARGAVRSCRTVSPLPAGWRDLARAVCFLWHCPWGRPRRPLTGTVFPWSPDFPPPLACTSSSGRPAVWRGDTCGRTPHRSSADAGPALMRACRAPNHLPLRRSQWQ